MAKQSGKHSIIEGVVEYLNFSPKGVYEAILLKTGKDRVQVNFPPEWSEQVANVVQSGDRVTAEVEEYDDSRPGQHRVYSLLSLSGAKGLQIGGTSGSAITGKVERINFAKHGEPNGAILDSGHFVHLKPGGARAVGLKVGQTLEVEGRPKPGARGAYQVIEAHWVNGIDLAHAKHPRRHPDTDHTAAVHQVPAKKRPPRKLAAKKAAAKKR